MPDTQIGPIVEHQTWWCSICNHRPHFDSLEEAQGHTTAMHQPEKEKKVQYDSRYEFMNWIFRWFETREEAEEYWRVVNKETSRHARQKPVPKEELQWVGAGWYYAERGRSHEDNVFLLHPREALRHTIEATERHLENYLEDQDNLRRYKEVLRKEGLSSDLEFVGPPTVIKKGETYELTKPVDFEGSEFCPHMQSLFDFMRDIGTALHWNKTLTVFCSKCKNKAVEINK